MKWSLIAAIFAVLVAPANSFAAEEWEKKLMDEGWVKLNFRNFPEGDRVNTTWFSLQSGNINYERVILFISSNGKEVFLKTQNFTDRGTREVTKDRICYTWDTAQARQRKCSPRDWTLWKKGNVTMVVSSGFGNEVGKYIIKKGNPENFK